VKYSLGNTVKHKFSFVAGWLTEEFGWRCATGASGAFISLQETCNSSTHENIWYTANQYLSRFYACMEDLL
jgi:hypothetical protein